MSSEKQHDGHNQQHFKIYSPSPTTTSYTVSSLSSPRSIASTALRHFIRVTIAFYAISVLVIKIHPLLYDHQPDIDEDNNNGQPDTSTIDMAAHYMLLFLSTAVRQSLDTLLCDLSLGFISTVVTLLLYLCLRRDYTEESLLVLQGLGIQTSTTSSYYLVSPTTTFIPTTRIQDIVIHEAFRGFGVVFYLAIIVEGETGVVVVFPTLLPKRAVLEQVWRGSRRCLYGNNE